MDDTPISSTTPSTRSMPCDARDRVEIAETPGDQQRRLLEFCREGGPARNRIGIAVDGDHAVVRIGVENGARVAACAERAVDESAAALRHRALSQTSSRSTGT